MGWVSVTDVSPPAAPRTASPPPAAGALALTARQLDYWFIRLRRTVRGSVITSFVTPVLYVVAMGLMLGRYVDAARPDLSGAPSYLAFVAPGLLAAQAMMVALGDSTYPVFGAVKWDKTYVGMLATPLRAGDVAAAQLLAIVTRVALSCGVFMAALALFGVYHGGLLGVAGAFATQLLGGLAFAAPCCAYAVATNTDAGFAIVFRVIQVPLFLFSGAFFPVSNLSQPLQWAAMATPLWHGVELTRAFVLGRVDLVAAAGHVAYLAVLAGVGSWLFARNLRRRLLS